MDLSTLAGAIIVVTSLLVLIVVSRLSSDGPGMAELFRLPTDLDWPRGVQEEEPIRWRIELLDSLRARDPVTSATEADSPGSDQSPIPVSRPRPLSEPRLS